MPTSESLTEASLLTNLLTPKTKTRLGTWNIRTLYESSRSAQVAKEMRRYKLKVLGLSETRWNGSGQTRLVSGETVIYSGHEDEDHEHTQGVAIMMSREATDALIAWEPVSPRLIAARFNAKGRKTTLIQCYAPTNAATDEEKEDFYSALQAQIDKSPKRDIKIVMGDMNAKVGTENKERGLTVGKNGIGIINENGELFADFCAFNNLIIGGTIFAHKDIHKTTWTSPDGKTKNQIDHITVSRKWRRSLMDVRAKRGADAASDHQLVVAILKLKLKSYRDRADKPHFKFNTTYLRFPKIKEDFNCAVKKIVNRMVRKSAKEDKRQFIQEMIEEAETAARQGKMKRLYEINQDTIRQEH
ncbi:craniofacial development protein 2-like [Physella acuta]|uniref:craniofacial development protein 2-like n=1 Tax=Physella acuta TaxID=109671 RepID=UPI0027DC0D16|nr:craniofacial development protein 2-like [Physella acuta]